MKRLIFLIAAVILTGCGATPPDIGDFVPCAPEEGAELRDLLPEAAANFERDRLEIGVETCYTVELPEVTEAGRAYYWEDGIENVDAIILTAFRTDDIDATLDHLRAGTAARGGAIWEEGDGWLTFTVEGSYALGWSGGRSTGGGEWVRVFQAFNKEDFTRLIPDAICQTD